MVALQPRMANVEAAVGQSRPLMEDTVSDTDFTNEDGTPMNGKQRREAKRRLRQAADAELTQRLMEEARTAEAETVADLDAAATKPDVKANKKLADYSHKRRQEEKAEAKTKRTTGAALPSLPRLPKAPRKAKTPKSCECGCGGMTRGGRFIPGHDARLHAWALRVERKLIKMSEVPAMHQKPVATLLKTRTAEAKKPIKL